MKLHDAALKSGKKKAWLGKIEQCELRLDVLHLVRLARIYGIRADKLVQAFAQELPE